MTSINQDNIYSSRPSNSQSQQEVKRDTIEAFASLFKGRIDSHGRINECIYEPVTLEHYERHLKGEVNLGIYFLLDDSSCYFAAIDLDEKDFTKTKAIRDELARNSIPAYIAASKSKGYHIYCFAFEKFKAVEIRWVLNHILSMLNIRAEIFPKQDYHQPNDPDGKKHPGSYINLPSFGYTRPFLSGGMKEVPLKVAVDQIKFVPQISIDRVLQTLTKEKPLEPKKVVSRRKKHPPCLEAISQGVDKQQREAATFALARHYLIQGYEPAEVLWLLQEWNANKNKTPGYNETFLENIVRSAEKYRGLVCPLIKDKPEVSAFCVGDEKCDWPKLKKLEAEPLAKERPEHLEEFNRLAIEQLLENCPFMRHCQDDAPTLSEPHWWSECDILSFFGEPGRQKAHELSQPYPKYTEEETNKKLEYAKEAKDKEVGPHTCSFVQQNLGFECPADCKAKEWNLKSPVVLANRLASSGLHVTIDGTTYFERLDINRIISRTKAKENAPPVIKTLASFVIKPKIRITLEGESERLDTVLKTGGAEYPALFRREVWNSKRQLLAALPSADLQYYGTDKDTQAILAMVTSKELPIRKGTTILGRNGDLWVLRNGVLSRDGWVENPELVYIPSEVEFDRRVHYPTPEDEAGLIKQIIPLLLMLNEGKIIFPILGWFFTTPFVPEIRHRLRHFPLLVVWGTHGGGKSSLLSLLWELFGVKSELFSSTETHFTFLRLFSGSSTIPIIIDEFKPFNMKEDETRLLIRFLKRLYDGEVEHRGKPDLSLVAYHLQTPTAIAGEVTPIALESAMAERVIQVNLNPDTLNANSTYVRAFNELSSLDLEAFALPYIRWSLGVNLDELMTEARSLLPATLREVPPRVRDNVLIMATGLVALKRFASQYDVPIAQDAFRTGINESVKELIAELFERGAHEEIGLTIFLETLATLAQTQRIKHGVHYTTDDINTRLYIHLPDCVAEFRKFVRETNARVEVLDERAYRRQAREVCQRKSYVLETNTNKWFKMYQTEKGEMGKIRKCIEIDLEQLPFDTSGFEEPVGD